ncbi:EGFlike domain containing protein [Acanthamoeba castellanii str. Neff]|uniref:EGFlike domain containing protein n=1 Tax=Acanthamoeba castellanii (strain ATCC 30010 / Neff) TaxID=1257118 RepID=L8HAA9_ACACF|nr:EGFlike domain containing protein [Acanthamoeba castellanii str. Neff]ELR22167.1 EGFlike domain containing protein [Acanthamoeba castellanii str. Neff]
MGKAGRTEPEATPCPYAESSFSSNATSTSWDDAENWEEGEVPDKTSDVVLDEGAESELDSTARVSSLSIKSGSKLTITGNLLVIPREITCFNVNYCSGHGTCVAEDTCECEAGWTGAECSEDASLPCERMTHMQRFLHEKRSAGLLGH